MRRISKIGPVEIHGNGLYVLEDERPKDVDAEMMMSAAGTHIVYLLEIRTPYITAVSKEHGWIDETQKEGIMQLWADPATTVTLEYDDGTTEPVRMASEKQIEFAPIYEGARYYRATIPMARV